LVDKIRHSRSLTTEFLFQLTLYKGAIFHKFSLGKRAGLCINTFVFPVKLANRSSALAGVEK